MLASTQEEGFFLEKEERKQINAGIPAFAGKLMLCLYLEPELPIAILHLSVPRLA